MDKTILTHSSRKTFQGCPRKYKLSYVDGYRPTEEREALFFGKLFHAGLEAWSKSGRDLSAAKKAVWDQMQEAENADEYLYAKISALLGGYHRRYKDEALVLVAAEQAFRTPILNPETAQESKLYVNEGVIDRIVMDDGRHKILETKTTVDDIAPDSDYWRLLSIDPQISNYYLGATALGYTVESCIYDVIRKPSLRPYKATPLEARKYTKDGKLYANQRENDETPEEYYNRLCIDIAQDADKYYARQEIPRSKSDLSEAMFDTWHTAQTIHFYELKDKWPRNTNSCVTTYGKCPYLNVCLGMASIEDEALFKKVEDVHPELAAHKSTKEEAQCKEKAAAQ